MKNGYSALPPGKKEIVKRIAEFEKKGGEYFFSDVENDPPSRTLNPDDVDYLNKKFSSKIKTFFAITIEKICQVLCKKKYMIKVEGKNNLENIKSGAIFTSNHFSITENLAVKTAADTAPGRRRFYKVIREGNYFMPGLIGFLLKNCRTLPLSGNVRTMMNLDKAVENILTYGDFILVYPEQAMWWNYKKPRPYRNGAYHYAAKNNVPVVPCFVTISHTEKNKTASYKYTVHIMEPIYPDPSISVSENTVIMRERNFALCKAKYEEIYHIPLKYGDCSEKDYI